MYFHAFYVVEVCFFFFNDTATTEIYTLSLHDALPICMWSGAAANGACCWTGRKATADRKSTRLNSSHRCISYAVFCLKKKKNTYKLPSRMYPVCRLLLQHTTRQNP